MPDLAQLQAMSIDELRAELAARKARSDTTLGVPPAESLEEFDEAAIVEVLNARQKVIYGVDDRVDIFTLTDPAAVADADSVVALFRANDITDNGNGTSTLLTQNFGAANNLCAAEPFRDQPVGAFCSGFLVDQDVIATAGHCVNASNVTTVRFVFGFRMQNQTTAQTVIANAQIYRGVAVIGREQVSNGADWALVRVDRQVADHPVVDVRREGRIPDSEPVHVIGHPNGLPTKFAGGASVRNNNPAGFFVANLDTYGGNSGSPVFNANTHEVEGILVRGENDFVQQGTCQVSLICPNTGCRGEDCTRTTEFVGLLPQPSHWEPLGGVFTSPPAVAAWGSNRLDIFGLGTDGAMFHKAWDGSAWQPSPNDWEPLGGVFTSPPAVAAWGSNRLDIFGLGTDGAMFHKAWDGSAWQPSPNDWEPLGGVFTSPPAVAAWGSNRLDIFGLGTDGAMFHKAWDGSAWQPSPNDWEPLGGVFTSPPAVAAWGSNRLDIFGLGTDGAMFHKAWDGSAWQPSPNDWEPLGGVFTSPPAVAAWGSNRLDIFGLGTDGAMFHKAWDGSAWQPSPNDWEPLGGVFTSPPAVAAWGSNRLDIFGLGTDGAMFHKAWDGSAWQPSPNDWEPLGGVFTSPPAVAAWGPNRLDIFGLGTDSAMYHKAWDGNAWQP